MSQDQILNANKSNVTSLAPVQGEEDRVGKEEGWFRGEEGSEQCSRGLELHVRLDALREYRERSPYRYIIASLHSPVAGTCLRLFTLPPPLQTQPIADITTTRLGWSSNLDDLPTLEAIITRDGVGELNSGKLRVLQSTEDDEASEEGTEGQRRPLRAPTSHQLTTS